MHSISNPCALVSPSKTSSPSPTAPTHFHLYHITHWLMLFSVPPTCYPSVPLKWGTHFCCFSRIVKEFCFSCFLISPLLLYAHLLEHLRTPTQHLDNFSASHQDVSKEINLSVHLDAACHRTLPPSSLLTFHHHPTSLISSNSFHPLLLIIHFVEHPPPFGFHFCSYFY